MSVGGADCGCGYAYVVSSPDPTLEEGKGSGELGLNLGPALRNFHAPMRSKLWFSHMTSLPQECNIAIRVGRRLLFKQYYQSLK